MHPVRKDVGRLIRRKIGECIAQFEPNFDYIGHAAFAQCAQEHQARQEPLLCEKVRLAAIRHKPLPPMQALRALLAQYSLSQCAGKARLCREELLQYHRAYGYTA